MFYHAQYFHCVQHESCRDTHGVSIHREVTVSGSFTLTVKMDGQICAQDSNDGQHMRDCRKWSRFYLSYLQTVPKTTISVMKQHKPKRWAEVNLNPQSWPKLKTRWAIVCSREWKWRSSRCLWGVRVNSSSVLLRPFVMLNPTMCDMTGYTRWQTNEQTHNDQRL